MANQLNDSTGVHLNIKWLIQIIIIVGVSVWGYSEITSRLTTLEHSFIMLKDKLDRTNSAIEESANGHNAWPLDVEQSTKIKKIEEDIKRIEDVYISSQIKHK